jgi:hypothetical protein
MKTPVQSMLRSVVFQLDMFGFVLRDWVETYGGPGDPLQFAWTSCREPRLMLRVLHAIDHPTVRPGGRFFVPRWRRWLPLGVPDPLDILEDVPQLPDCLELSNCWALRGRRTGYDRA